MSDDILERLLTAKGSVRHGPLDDGSYGLGLLNNVDLCHEAADEIERLRADLAVAREALLDCNRHEVAPYFGRDSVWRWSAADPMPDFEDVPVMSADLTRLLSEPDSEYSAEHVAVTADIDTHIDACRECQSYLDDDDDIIGPCPTLAELHDRYDHPHPAWKEDR